MKKTKINLLSSRVDYQKIEKYFFYVRVAAIASCVVFFGVFLYMFLRLNNQNSRLQTLLEQKKSYLEQLQDKKDIEAQLLYIERKYDVIKEFKKDDVEALPYFNLLINALSQSTSSSTNASAPAVPVASLSGNLASISAQVETSAKGTLKDFFIDKGRSVEFKVVFNDFPSLIDFTKLVESEKFLKNFEWLSLKSFSLGGLSSTEPGAAKKENYELSLNGKFILMNETKN